VDVLWLGLVLAVTAYAGWKIVEYVHASLTLADVTTAVGMGLVTLLRVVLLIALATLIWVPVGLDRPAAQAGGKGPATGSIPGGFPGEYPLPCRRDRYRS
jgi:hypothetical protein